MTDSAVTDWSATAASNTTVGGGTNIDENCAMSGLNNGERAIMAGIKGALTFVASSGTDTYTATLAPVPGAYVTNAVYLVNIGAANTSTTPTLNLNSLGAKTITKTDGTALVAGNLNGPHFFQYDGTNLRVLNPVVKLATTNLTDVTAPTSWSPTDQSGATLTFTSVSANYTKIGNMVYAYGTLTFPTTADGSTVAISLPVAVPNQSYAGVPGAISIAGSSGSFTPGIVARKNTSTFSITNGAANAGALQVNSTFSAATITFMLIYPAA